MIPDVSVIIPMFNATRWIAETLTSVTAQTLPREQIEIIVVDDGSTDGSAAIVAQEFPLARLIRTTNGGPSRARNLGTQAARGKYIQYLDADDLLLPSKLTVQVEALEKSQADVAYGDWQPLIEQHAGGFVTGAAKGGQLLEDPTIALFTDAYWAPPAAWLFRRSMVDRIGQWNERLPIIQDARFVLDAALLGGRFVHCPGVMAKYRIHGGPSVSRQDPVAFTRDCYANAVEVEQWFRDHKGITAPRLAALMRVYGQVARASFTRDRATFEAAYEALERLQPGYIPAKPRHLALASRLMGYRRAEALAQRVRHYTTNWRGIRR